MQAIGLVLVAFAAMVVTMATAYAAGANQLTGFAIGYGSAAAAVIAVARRRLGLATIGLAWPPARFLAAGALIGISLWYVDLQLVEWLPVPEHAPALEREVSQQGLSITLLVIAMMPAATEELVFRGVLARGLATRLPMAVAIAVSAIVFSLIHGNPAQMVSTFPLGLALGFVAIRAGSIAPTVLAHFTNNAVVILISREDLPFVERAVMAHPGVAFAAALVIAAGGIALAARGAVA